LAFLATLAVQWPRASSNAQSDHDFFRPPRFYEKFSKIAALALATRRLA
jgi:hypothetical protein